MHPLRTGQLRGAKAGEQRDAVGVVGVPGALRCTRVPTIPNGPNAHRPTLNLNVRTVSPNSVLLQRRRPECLIPRPLACHRLFAK
jgi:hypothetical protein